ncbi:MAG: aspartate kinase [Candidatus Bathyarchaeota archaeon]|nr:aspartate kinase [Candidatus Bathyarchaeota archaeon]
MNNRVVIKFGGADLATGEKVEQAAKMVAQAPYKEKVVVVSAMGKTTDTLVATLNQFNNLSDEDYAEVVSMGERTSARVFCGALRSIGVHATLFDPSQDNWPIITDSNFRDAQPLQEKTCELTRKFLVPTLRESVAVICGFLGKTTGGKVTTLGRGGSDTTAILLANILEADEVILVKETSGIMSADPKIVPAPRFISKLDIHEIFDLVQGGAKIVKPEALKYKLPTQKLRIVSFDSQDLSLGGTEITGSFQMNSVEVDTYENLVAINIVCDVNSDNIKEVFAALERKIIYGVSSGKKSITVFTTDGDINQLINRLHKVESFKAISHREKVAMLQISHPMFIDSPGGVAKISNALSQRAINIIEVTTSKATINVFIGENQLKRAEEAVKHVFET